MSLSKENLEKKQDLILKYHELILKLEMERKTINGRINNARKKFIDLIKIEATTDQLSLFEDMSDLEENSEN
jgi:hypothetical protein